MLHANNIPANNCYLQGSENGRVVTIAQTRPMTKSDYTMKILPFCSILATLQITVICSVVRMAEWLRLRVCYRPSLQWAEISWNAALYWFLVCLCTSYQSARNIFINSGESLSFSENELLVVFGQEKGWDLIIDNTYLYSASSLKQQSAEGHVVPLGHFILILSQPVFALFPYC
jgi:hypothetical protein